MRHRKARRKLGRSGSHRRAMYDTMLTALIEHGHVTTTERKARDLRSLAERCVTRATTLGDLLLKDPKTLPPEDVARMIHTIRMVRRNVRSPQVALELLREVAPRYLGRPGGYTRICKLGPRRGDGAPMVLLEFVDAEMPVREWLKQEEGAKQEKKGLFARFRRRAATAE